MDNNSNVKKGRHLVWLGIIIAFIAICVAVLGSFILYKRTVALLTENLRERLLTISITAAANINAKDLDALQVEADWQKPEWSRVVNTLHKAKYSNKDIVFMYIFRKKSNDQSQMQFVADADSIDPYANTGGDSSRYVDVNRDGKVEADGPDKLQWPGQDYPEAVDIPEAFQAYDGPLTSADIYTDDYGSVLTGYAPITDENGKTVAILGTDIKAGDFFTITTQTLYPFLLFILFLISIIVALAFFLIRIWKKQVDVLAEKAELSEKLAVANAGQTNLIHIMNHQIKGYLGTNKNIFAELLTDDYGAMPEGNLPLLQKGLEGSDAGVKYVTEILKGASAENGTLPYDMKPMDFKNLVSEATQKQKEIAEKKGLKFTLNIEKGNYNIIGDSLQLGEAIRNLINNSISYTPSGSVSVSLSPTGNLIQLIVKDTGVGIKEEDKSKLFKAGGVGADSIKVNVNSSGYGLVFTKGVILAHKGKIWFESAGEGKGSTFFVDIPIK